MTWPQFLVTMVGNWIRQALLLGMLVLLGCGESGMSQQDPMEEFVLSTQSQSKARAEAVLSLQGSEDVRHLLEPIDLPDLESNQNEEAEYAPNPAVEWVIEIEFTELEQISVAQLKEIIDGTFDQEEGRPTIFGKDAQTNQWTYAIAADGPESVTAVQLAWDYFQAWKGPESICNELGFQKRLDATSAVLQEHSIAANITPSRLPKEAFARTEELAELPEEYDKYFIIQLQAPEGTVFEGRDIWDVMHCLGLTWGDMDCFHWENPSGIGDDYFFSVESTTPPGFFLPEQIAAGELQTEDLIFLFSIPRSAAPLEVISRMDTAAHYAQKRLGGTIHYQVGEDRMSLEDATNEVRQMADILTENGFQPGSDSALQLF
ncbi:cell division protein ZipA C-terminal FtsZ-binding domain-containing protein [Bremerella cremea]|uniref:cell division protein ZipA C-terminal FtsZ-binding domain-containing protein n=1 Tax=Bremerella cremea TaxID=1031537 RepID=UPI0031ED1EA7